MTANIEFLQAALAAASAQSAPNVYHPCINYHPSLPAPLPHLCSTSPLGNVASSGSISPPHRAVMALEPVSGVSAGYTSTQWSGGVSGGGPPLLGYFQPQAPFPLQLTRTPTTRDLSSVAGAPPSPFPTPPATPASGSAVCHASHTRFPFPPLPSYNLALAALAQHPPNNGVAPPNYFIPFGPILPGTLADNTPSPTPSPTHSPHTLLPTSSPVTCNVYTDTVSHSLFLSYLDEVWPHSPLRRSSSVIRSSLYDKIVSVLQGQTEAKGREKIWIKKSEFFLVEKEGRGSLLAVPVGRSRTSKRGASEGDGGGGGGGGKSGTKRQSYRLVARLEDFYYIISSYHNNTVGHHGIRKTFGLVRANCL